MWGLMPVHQRGGAYPRGFPSGGFCVPASPRGTLCASVRERARPRGFSRRCGLLPAGTVNSPASPFALPMSVPAIPRHHLRIESFEMFGCCLECMYLCISFFCLHLPREIHPGTYLGVHVYSTSPGATHLCGSACNNMRTQFWLTGYAHGESLGCTRPRVFPWAGTFTPVYTNEVAYGEVRGGACGCGGSTPR
ncbi:hypothetical protein C8F04DRAFT_174805 [Mycena alexandri]|uniref:Uncharacterized protein n=1 Tax=Mycena alexandri TaxID=1745969 RepID=A0AAD6SBF2_9AGAR|nr:hypothetical protein C8F04DRAFT_174805 [Mycena alexandri]